MRIITIMSLWNNKTRMLLVERLEAYVSAGLSPDVAVTAASAGFSKSKRISLDGVVETVESGRKLSSALASEVGLPRALAGIVRCGESSGDLAGALASCRDLMEKRDEAIKKLLSASAYPTAIAAAAFGLTMGMLRLVMPQIIPVLRGLGGELPPLTKAVIAISQYVENYGLWMIVGVAAAVSAAAGAYRRLPAARSAAHSVLAAVPVAGSMARRFSLVLFLRSFGALAEAGLPVDEAYGQAVSAVAFEPLRRSLAAGLEPIRRGRPVSESMSLDIPLFLAPLLAAGESGGGLGRALRRAADVVDKDLGHDMKRLSALLEPVMMTITGAAVGAIAMSIMMPIYDISRVLQR